MAKTKRKSGARGVSKEEITIGTPGQYGFYGDALGS